MLLERKAPHLVPVRRPLVYSAGPERIDIPRSEFVSTESPLVVREFAYVNGRWNERPVSPIPPPRGKARKGQLYVLADVDGKAADAVADRLRQATADAFYRDPSGSLTSALVRAIRQASDDLYGENQRSIRSDRHYATLCCAVFRDSDAFFAMAGAGLGYLISSDHGERFGWDDPSGSGRTVELVGQVDDVDVQLHHRTLDGPTAIILTSSGFVDLVGDHSADALRAEPDRVLHGLRVVGERHQGRHSFRALAITPNRDVLNEPEPVWEEIVVEPEPPVTFKGGRNANHRRPPRRVAAPDTPFGSSLPRQDPPIAPPRPGRRPRGVDDWQKDVAEVDDVVVPRRRVANVLFLPRDLSRIAISAAMLVALFLAGYLGMLVVARLVQGGAGYSSAMSVLTQAQQREREAMGQNDPLVRRHLLDEANQLASTALTRQPDDALTITTAGRIQREYRAASGMTAMPTPTVLVALPTTADRMILNGMDLYVLDRANSRLYKYLLNADGTSVQATANPILVQEGDRIGQATIGKITAMAWMAASGNQSTSRLLALDSSGLLIQYDPTHALTVARLRDPGSWTNVNAIAGFGGNLYALNATQQTLAWYPPQDGGYDGPVYNYFSAGVTANLSDAVALSMDGNLYVLHANGQIQKFVDGKPVEFSGPPSDLMPSHPAGLATSSGSVYVGDPEHSRIVQVSATGVYQRVLTSDANQNILSHLQDLVVPDGAKAAYVLADGKIYRFPLPEIQQ